MDECLKQVTNRLDLLTSAILPKVWQETHATSLKAPDSMSQVNNDFSKHKRQTVGQIDPKGKSKPPVRCPTCGKKHTEEPAREQTRHQAHVTTAKQTRNQNMSLITTQT